MSNFARHDKAGIAQHMEQRRLGTGPFAPRPAKGQQWTATGDEDAGAGGARTYECRGAKPTAHRVTLTPGRRTAEKDAYHELCRQKFLDWDPVIFGGVGPGELVLVRCPHPRCFYGGVDLDEVEGHFERFVGHFTPGVDELDCSIINPVYDGEEPRTDGAYA
jgi:hypothetical protein